MNSTNSSKLGLRACRTKKLDEAQASISAFKETAFTDFTPPEGKTWSEKMAEVSPEDLQAPEMEAELAEGTRTAVSA